MYFLDNNDHHHKGCQFGHMNQYSHYYYYFQHIIKWSNSIEIHYMKYSSESQMKSGVSLRTIRY